MTESEWLNCIDPRPMLDFLQGEASDRKLWLFSCGCCRRHWHVMDARCREAVEVGELYADGRESYDRLMESAEEAYCRRSDVLAHDPLAEAVAVAAAFAVVDIKNRDSALPFRTTAETVKDACDDVVSVAERKEPVGASRQAATNAEHSAQAELLREIIGDPFRPIAIDPAHLTPAIIDLAQTIYNIRKFEKMPELADALEHAGCRNADILDHCRGAGPHVRGCWVVDLVLGKA